MADVNGIIRENGNESCDDVIIEETGKNRFFDGLETLEVDNILDARETKDCRQYLVSFKSWIAEDYLQDYRDLLKTFWNLKSREEAERHKKNGNIDLIQTNGYVIDYEEDSREENGDAGTPPNEVEQTPDAYEVLRKDDVEENGTPIYHEGESLDEDKENDDISNQTSSGTSSESLEINILKECNPSGKKRKLKTLDDIVRKITKNNDTTSDTRHNSSDDDVKLTDRLFTLDQTLNEDIVKREEDETTENMLIKEEIQDNESSIKAPSKNGHIEKNVYWSAGKAYHKTGHEQHNGEEVTHEDTQHTSPPSEKIPSPPATQQQVKSRQRYHKCRFCSTLYSDPALLERHENSHFTYKARHGMPFHEGIPPPPLVPVSEDRREFPQYRSTSPKQFTHPPTTNHHLEVGSIIRKPIRNLLSKMYESESRDGYPAPRYPSPEYNNKRTPSPTNGYSPKDLPVKEKAPPREVVCPLCKNRFDKRESFEQHFDSAHPEASKFMCSSCDEVYLSKEHLEAHACQFSHNSFDQKSTYEKTHLQQTHAQERPFRCHVCGRSFSLRTNLRRHLLVHSDGTPYFCQFCGKGFRRSDLLNAHIKEHHLTSNNETAVNGHADSHRRHHVDGGDPHVYPSMYERRHSDSSHNGSHHTSPRQMEHSPSRSSNASHDSNEQQHYEPVKMLPPSTRYYKEHGAAYPYDPTFSAGHSPNNKYKTNVKPQHTAYREGDPAMFYHQGRKHANELYESNRHLVKMVPVVKQRSFSPIKPNPVKMVAMPSQVVQQHQVGTGGAFECLKCGEKFSSPSLYDIHVQSHKEVFECEKCHKSFAVRSQYDVHMQSHDNNKSHKCPYCHRSFSMKGNLRRHIRIHTNEAPYECPICFQRFRRSDGLKGHIKRHETLGESAPTDLLLSQAS